MPFSDGGEVALARALRRGGAVVALVAVEDGRIAGQVMLSRAWIAGRPSAWHALGPLAVAPGLQRRGVGGALVRAGLDRLQALGSAGCMVLGDTRYYARFGFRPAPDLCPAGLPAAHFMVRSAGDAAPAGPLAFDPAFG